MKELIKPTKLKKREFTLVQYGECDYNKCNTNYKDPCGYNVCTFNYATEEGEDILF